MNATINNMLQMEAIYKKLEENNPLTLQKVKEEMPHLYGDSLKTVMNTVTLNRQRLYEQFVPQLQSIIDSCVKDEMDRRLERIRYLGEMEDFSHFLSRLEGKSGNAVNMEYSEFVIGEQAGRKKAHERLMCEINNLLYQIEQVQDDHLSDLKEDSKRYLPSSN